MNHMTDERKNQGGYSSRVTRAEEQKHLPQDLLPKVTVLLQGSGYVTISPRALTRPDWRRIDEKVRRLGGLWVSNERHNHWRSEEHTSELQSRLHLACRLLLEIN